MFSRIALPLIAAAADAAMLRPRLATGVPAARSLSMTRSIAPLRPIGIRRFRATPAMSEGDIKKGTCKWFDTAKGFGFISIDGEDQDVFVHQSDIYARGFRSLAEGETLEFKMTTDPRSGKNKAVEVTGPDGGYVQGSPRPDYNDDY